MGATRGNRRRTGRGLFLARGVSLPSAYAVERSNDCWQCHCESDPADEDRHGGSVASARQPAAARGGGSQSRPSQRWTARVWHWSKLIHRWLSRIRNRLRRVATTLLRSTRSHAPRLGRWSVLI